MIEWLQRVDPGRVFLESRDGVLTYGETLAAIRERDPDRIEVVRPRLDFDSVVDVLAAMSNGCALILGPSAPDPGPVDPGDAVCVIYTSGTGGRSKGVRLTLGNWEAAVRASAAHLDHQPDDTWLLAMPLHHVGGLSIVLRSAFVGARVRVEPGFDPARFAAGLHQVTLASVVPTMLRRVLETDPGPYRGLKAVLVGGGPIPAGMLERGAGAGLPVLPTYGMTETCGQIATLLPGAALGYRAHPLPGVEIRIEQDGRVAVRGGMVSPGYLGEEVRTPDVWFVTGDMGRIDEEGAVSVLGRADTMIVTGGENVDPDRVASALLDHRGVGAALVVGVPSDEWGMEVGCLYVGDVDPDVLAEWLAGRLAGFQVPKRWLKVDTVPTTDLGKPDRARAVRLLS